MTTTSSRFAALDVFRGMTIIFMIIVNSPGHWEHSFAPLKHAEWHGFTPTDLVFPSFLFALGAALSFSMKKWSGLPGKQVASKIFKRTVLLFLLGYLMYWYPFFRMDYSWEVSAFPISQTRIFGVLQRIALAYGITAALLHFIGTRWTYGIAIALLPIYWVLLLNFGLEGFDPFSLEGNAVRLLDIRLFGASHLYTGDGIPFDPEGLLSTLTCIANVAAGHAAGAFIQRRGNAKNTRLDLALIAGLVFLVAFTWNLVFPFNKKLWSSSFALLTIAIDLGIIALLLTLLPKQGQTPAWGRFFEIAGKNPLFIYLLSEIGLITLYFLPISGQSTWSFLFLNGFAWMGLKLGSFVMAATFSLSCWAVGYYLHKKRIYIKV